MALLDVVEVDVRFGGIHAVQGASIDVGAGYVTGLIGPNGAGKTTLFNVICGLQEPTQGRVVLDAVDITNKKAHARARLGIARTFQRLEVFGSLTARDNVRVAAEIRRRWSRDGSDPQSITDELLDRVGLGAVAGSRVDALPTGMARLVELARALATRPRVLLLDEPSSGLDEQESDDFAGLLRSLAADGLAVLLVEHDVDLVMEVCTRIHVLDFGRIIAVGEPKEIRSDAAVQAAYLGSESGAAESAGPSTATATARTNETGTPSRAERSRIVQKWL
jgi:branched-chain amino acid transport system ATP-binding protein